MPYPALSPELPAVFVFSQQRETNRDLWFTSTRDLTFYRPDSKRKKVLFAQAVVPAADGVGTQVIPHGDRLDITGGKLSVNGANLFHSFRQFSLGQGQVANFLSNPQILNILSRIVGGEASIINGKIQISGGNSNLFLINPAGILFGPNASLNVPAAFTATTANAIAFGNQWFNTIGDNPYVTLNQMPSGLAFTTPNPGAIANAANLSVARGQRLSLIGGSVISTGKLSAPEGEITLASVPGKSLVQLNQAGSLLSLELKKTDNSLPPAPNTIPPLSLAELLTGGNEAHATGISVNNDGDIVLTSSGTVVDARIGTTVVAGQVDVSGQRGGSGRILGDRVGLVSVTVQASGTNGGGTVLIGGDLQGNGSIPNASSTYISPDSSIHADAVNSGNGGRVIAWADNTTAFYGNITARGAASAPTSNGGFAEVSGKQNLIFRGTVDLSASTGSMGTLLLDPVDINIVGGAGGAQDGNLPTILFGATPATFTISQTALQSQASAIVLQASNNIAIANGVSLNFVPGGPITFVADADNSGAGTFLMDLTQTIRAPSRNLTISGATLNLGSLDTSSIAAGNSTGGNITLSARNNITTGAISTSASATTPGTPTATGGDVAINAGGEVTTGSITTLAVTASAVGSSATGGDVSLAANRGNVIFDSINTSGNNAASSAGGKVVVVANGVVQGTATGNTILTTGSAQSGSVGIQHSGGPTNIPFTVGSPSVNGTAGAINAGGASVIAAGVFPVLPNGGNAVVGALPNTIILTSVNQPPTLTINQTLAGAVQDQPFTFTYAAFAPAIADANLDQTILTIAAINKGTLAVNGAPAIPGVTTLSPGDILVYTPPSGASGLLTSAFSLALTDRVSFSANSPAQVDVNIQAVSRPSPLPPTLPPPPDTLPPSPIVPATPNGQSPNQSVEAIATVLERPKPPISQLTLQSLTNLPCNSTDIGVNSLDDQYAQEFEQYLGKRLETSKSKLLEACSVLNQVEASTGVKPAIIYASFVPGSLQLNLPSTQTKSLPPFLPIAQLQESRPVAGYQDSDELELIVVLPNGLPIYKRVSGASRAEVLNVANQFLTAITDPTTRETTAYLTPAQQLYQWFVKPLEATLQAKKVENLVFIMDAGLRSLPLAALHDGNQFLIERYSIGLMPSLSLTDTRYRDLKNAQVLAMGASQFEEQIDLLAVPIELSTIFDEHWDGKSFLNESFTLSNLKFQRQQQPYGIIHLATHAEFKPGSPDKSYIQLWDTKLRLDQLQQLGWNNPPVQLLVLSACRTALGDMQAELGFAGLAYQSGVSSALASLWAVNDEATLAFMAEFYRQLKTSPIKAEAVRQAQLAMVHKQVKLDKGNLITPSGTIPLPPELQVEDEDLSFPFYWAAFTLVGNPW